MIRCWFLSDAPAMAAPRDWGRGRIVLAFRALSHLLPPEPLEAVRELRTAVTLVREPGDEQRERLRVTGDPQGPSVHGIEPHVADQLGGNLLAARIVSAIDEAGSCSFAPSLEHPKQHFARHRAEGGDDPSLRNLLGQCLSARGGVSDHEVGIVGIHRERAGDDDLARHVACLFQDVVDAGPVHREQECVRFARGFSWRASLGVPLRLACELLELLLAARVAEYHFMSGARPDRSELGAHQSRAENADAHGTSPEVYLAGIGLFRSRRSFARARVAEKKEEQKMTLRL